MLSRQGCCGPPPPGSAQGDTLGGADGRRPRGKGKEAFDKEPERVMGEEKLAVEP